MYSKYTTFSRLVLPSTKSRFTVQDDYSTVLMIFCQNAGFLSRGWTPLRRFTTMISQQYKPLELECGLVLAKIWHTVKCALY